MIHQIIALVSVSPKRSTRQIRHQVIPNHVQSFKISVDVALFPCFLIVLENGSPARVSVVSIPNQKVWFGGSQFRNHTINRQKSVRIHITPKPVVCVNQNKFSSHFPNSLYDYFDGIRRPNPVVWFMSITVFRL